MLSRSTSRSNTLLQTHNRRSILRTRLLRQRKKTLHRQRHKPQHAPFQNTNSSGDGFPPRLPPRNERNLLQYTLLLGLISENTTGTGIISLCQPATAFCSAFSFDDTFSSQLFDDFLYPAFGQSDNLLQFSNGYSRIFPYGCQDFLVTFLITFLVTFQITFFCYLPDTHAKPVSSMRA